MKKFLPWLVLFIVLLISVPVFVHFQYIGTAKVIGFILIITTFLALRIWMRAAIKKKFTPDSVKLNANHRFFLNEISPIYKGMTSGDKKELEKRVGKLIAELQFDDTTREQLDQDDLLSYALLQVFSIYKEEYHSLKGMMVVFDLTNTTEELKLVDGKYILMNPETVKTLLKTTFNIDDFANGRHRLSMQLRELYLAQ